MSLPRSRSRSPTMIGPAKPLYRTNTNGGRMMKRAPPMRGSVNRSGFRGRVLPFNRNQEALNQRSVGYEPIMNSKTNDGVLINVPRRPSRSEFPQEYQDGYQGYDGYDPKYAEPTPQMHDYPSLGRFQTSGGFRDYPEDADYGNGPPVQYPGREGISGSYDRVSYDYGPEETKGGFQSRGNFEPSYPDDSYSENKAPLKEARPGDWTCTLCAFSNFATRTSCYKCQKEKGSAPDTLSLKNWECTECYASNHERRFECFKCQKAKPKNAKECSQLQDWDCPNCKCMNHARRTNCARCDRARPGREKELEANPDWKCGGCGIMNWSWRDSCYKCQASKADGKVPEDAPQDWNCAQCGISNWARRVSCYKCRTDRNGKAAPSSEPADWDCKECGQSNWARRNECYKCKAHRS